MGVRTSFRQGLLCAAAIITAMAMPADTLALEPAEFTIEAAPLGDALRAFSQQSGRAILFSEGTVSGLTAPRLTGTYEPEAALGLLLQGTGLEFTQGPNGNLIVRRQTGADPVQTPEPGRGRGREVSGEPDPETDSRRIETITVTGTSIRGIAPESSPFQMFTREEIFESGLASTEQFLRTIPQLFGGGSSEFVPVTLPNDSNSGQNNTAGSSANLRGLGSRGTLVLLNGNRVAPSSQIGDFVDLSLIPVSAIERIDLLTDGASSIYGGDAIAGVVNFILRDDFDGAETSLRYGNVTSGDMREIRLSQTLGRAWGSGNLLATYEYYDRDALSLADRPDIDIFPPRTPSVVLPDPAFFSLLPGQERHSGVISVRQDFQDRAVGHASLLYSDRSSRSTRFSDSGVVNLSKATSQNLTASVGLDYELSPSWYANIGSTFSRIESESRTRGFLGGGIDVHIGTDTELWSLDAKIDGSLFSLPAGDMRIAIGGHYREESILNQNLGGSVSAEGSRQVQAAFSEILIPLVSANNRFTGVEDLTVNLSARVEDYSDYGTDFSPKIGVAWSPLRDLRLRASYSESFAPPAMGRAFSLSRGGFVFPYELYLNLLANADLPDPAFSGTNIMILNGTQAGLEAETSETFTAGFDYDHERENHTWSINASYYNISFNGRLGAVPVPENISRDLITVLVWNDPESFPAGTVQFFPSEDELNDVLASLQLPLGFDAGATLENIGVIDRSGLIRNLASTKTDGFDVSAQYAYRTDFGRFFAGVNVNYINSFTNQAASTTPRVNALNTLYNPVDLSVRANVGFSTDQIVGNLYINHIADYVSDESDTGRPIGAWTTFDTSASYQFSGGRDFLQGATVRLSVTNLLDTPPPSVPALGRATLSGYDPTNASPVGRLVAVEIRQTF